MAVKIESSIDDVKNWLSEQEVYDILSSFDVIQTNEFNMSEKKYIISLKEINKDQENRTMQKPKIDIAFSSIKGNEKFEQVIVGAA